MHIVLFAICLNFGLGIAHIPGTPISLSDASTAQDISCFNDFTANGMLTYVNATDASGNPVTGNTYYFHQNTVSKLKKITIMLAKKNYT